MKKENAEKTRASRSLKNGERRAVCFRCPIHIIERHAGRNSSFTQEILDGLDLLEEKRKNE